MNILENVYLVYPFFVCCAAIGVFLAVMAVSGFLWDVERALKGGRGYGFRDRFWYCVSFFMGAFVGINSMSALFLLWGL